MKKIILSLICVIPFVVSGKETKKVVIEYIYPAYKEIFYVLKSDSTVKHGPYRMVLSGKILIDGSYKMGMKDSLWIQQNEKGKLRFRGFYAENRRVGIWEFNDEKGEPEQKLDFTNNQIILYRSKLIGHTFRLHSGTDSTYSLLDRPPLYLGGMSRINEFIANEIAPPLHKADEKVLGTVFVEFTIDSVGKTSGHHILRGIGTRCNEEALRVVKALPEEWFPGVLNDRNVTVDYIIPVIFDEKLYDSEPYIFNNNI
jgi:protein TonB